MYEFLHWWKKVMIYTVAIYRLSLKSNFMVGHVYSIACKEK